MIDFMRTVFLPSSIAPHSEHFIPNHINLMWFIILSNALIVLAYALIPATTLFLVRKRKDLVFSKVFLMIGLFITLCGLTHLMHIIVFWYSLYWLQGIVELLTVFASLVTFFVLLFTKNSKT